MKVAIITCAEHPQGVTEDKPLFAALEQSKIEYEICIWDQPNDWSQFDICLFRSVWDYHEKSNAFMNWVNQTSELTTLLNPAPVIQWNSDKRYLQELQKHKISIAPTVWLAKQSKINLQSEINKLPEAKQYFLKPTIGADSSGTFRIKAENIAEAQQHLNHWIAKHDMILQSYLPSVESYGEVSLIFFGGQFSHAIRKIPVQGDYRVQDTFGATDVPHQPNQEELIIAESTNNLINQKFGNLCYIRIDLLQLDNKKPVINEIELIEPSLFLHHDTKAAEMLVKAMLCKNP